MQPSANRPYSFHQNQRLLRIQDQKLHGAAFLDLERDACRAGSRFQPALAVRPSAGLDLSELHGIKACMVPDFRDELFSQSDGCRMGPAALVSLESFHVLHYIPRFGHIPSRALLLSKILI